MSVGHLNLFKTINFSYNISSCFYKNVKISIFTKMRKFKSSILKEISLAFATMCNISIIRLTITFSLNKNKNNLTKLYHIILPN